MIITKTCKHFLFILFFPIISFCLADLSTNFTDYASLQSFKSQLKLQPNSLLSTNWTSNTHFCSWVGVLCSKNQRVLSLNLPGLDLSGTISPRIGNLTRLVSLDLSDNTFYGPLPSELGRLNRLKVLNLTNNHFHGTLAGDMCQCQGLEELDLADNAIIGAIPRELGWLSNLRVLRINDNNFTGKVPTSFGNFSKLEYVFLHENRLDGEIPEEIGNLRSLKVISFRGNSFTGKIPHLVFNNSVLQIVDFSINGFTGALPDDLGRWVPNLERLFLDSNRITGSISGYLSNASNTEFLFLTNNDFHGNLPTELGMLKKLQWLEFEDNRISGTLPFTVFNISSLRILKTRHNYLRGDLPYNLGLGIPNLEELFLSHNQFTGQIPVYISNASKLVYFEVANNSFKGELPLNLGNLVKLQHFNFENNLLENTLGENTLKFLESMENCRQLEFLILARNPLRGTLPESIGNLSSTLKVIDASLCDIQGYIPRGLGNLSSIWYLGLNYNSIQGTIPLSFVGLQKLERLYLNHNRLEGVISPEICSLKSLGLLDLDENMLSGAIPTYIRNLTELTMLSLAANKFHSEIPSSFWKLVKLQGLNLSRNHFNGSISPEVGNLKAVYIFDLSSNTFTNIIPSSIGQLQSLVGLDLSNNSFEGLIPESLGKLVVLESLDLSKNSLSGSIPKSLELLQDLKLLNLSFNRLEGDIPQKGAFANFTIESFIGNPRLCGSVLNNTICSSQAKKRSISVSHIVKIVAPVIATILVSVICISMWIIFRKKKSPNSGENRLSGAPKTEHPFITYRDILYATDHFSEANLLGSGSSGKVYKGVLFDETVVAIKVFDMQNEGTIKNFDVECKVLSNARHRNLVRIISSCSTLDFKAMVLEYMPNGTLDKWLYSHNNFLSLVQRIDILIDVASALEYLHHDYTVPIIHCDLKPSNVLLNEDMTAHVADFGIAKLLAIDQVGVHTKTLGTIGYIAPEYGMDGHVSTSGDVYSFGILMLETLTRKRPTDDMFGGDLTLRQWVITYFPNDLAHILDPNLVGDFGVEKDCIEGSISLIIDLAFLCLKESPEERINMRDVVVDLKKIKQKSKNEQ